MEIIRPAIEAATRKFIFGSHSAFEELQQSIVSTEDTSLTPMIERASDKYKESIATYAQDILALSEQAEQMKMSDEILHFLDVEINVAENIHQLWNLSDLCLLSQRLTKEAEGWLKVSLPQLKNLNIIFDSPLWWRSTWRVISPSLEPWSDLRTVLAKTSSWVSLM